MKKSGEFIRYFLFFMAVGLLLLVTYSLSFYKIDIVFLLTSPLKILYIVIISILLSVYYSAYLVFNVKNGRIFNFIGSILVLFVLHDYQKNFFLGWFLSGYEDVYYLINIAAAVLSAIFLSLSDFYQLKPDFRIKIKKQSNHHHNESDYFV